MTVIPNATCPKCNGPATRAFVETYCLACDPKSATTKTLPYKEVVLNDGAVVHYYNGTIPENGKYTKGYWLTKEPESKMAYLEENDMWDIVRCYGSYDELRKYIVGGGGGRAHIVLK